ncbi:MAG TPA: gamma carbonic anhydrase family protein [Rhodanobacteraceae bacterium]|nr:gamma carbonic anhydrase family protein [Rhodanobacteraceae bacterium]
MASLRAFDDHLPRLGARVYVDAAAVVIGHVELGDDASIWPQAVVRGDVARIRIGARTNVQDGAILHVTHASAAVPAGWPCLVGADVTIGHAAVVHACTLEEACLIGMHATVLDGAVVQHHALVGAGALVAPGKIVGAGELWVGNPARRVRRLSDAEIAALDDSARRYVALKDVYLALRT